MYKSLVLLSALLFVSYPTAAKAQNNYSSGVAVGYATGLAAGRSSSSRKGSSVAGISSALCPDKEFAVVECRHRAEKTQGSNFYMMRMCRDGITFRQVVQDTNLKNAELFDVFYDDYNNKFILVVCYDAE